jgi:hypothetical protein
LDCFQHGRIGFLSVDQRIDPIAPQQGSLYHTPNDPSQHLEMPSVIRQVALQFFRQTFGLRGLRPVSLQVLSQQSGPMANAIQAEEEVHDSPDQGHEPNETHPRDGGARVTFVENRVPSRQPSEKQPQSDGSDVPGVVQQIPNSHRHCYLSLRLVLFVFMAHFLSTREAENAAHHLGYHAFFVRANDADRNSARRHGNHASGVAVPE